MSTAGPSVLRLGTRGSMLARAQSQMVATELERLHPGLRVELIICKTTGDVILDRPLHDLGGKGLFTKELEQALLAGEVDFAVHSFKDVPVTMPLVDQSDLVIAAVPPREDPRDVIASRLGKAIADLPPGARVGTGSMRRKCQILAARPDLRIEMIRGNIDTRLRRLNEGHYEAVILALAGLRRSGLADHSYMTPLDPTVVLPAAGQGALALQCRRSDRHARELLAAMNDRATATAVSAERAIVQGLSGDCHSPIAAWATVQDDDQLTIHAAVGARDGEPPVLRAHGYGAADSAVAAVLKSLSDQNVQAILGTGR